MNIVIALLLGSALLGCLRKPAANNSKPQATSEVCYKDFFSTLEGKRLSEAMRAANEERSGWSMSNFGLNQARNYLEPLYHTRFSNFGLGILRPRWAMFDVISLYGYAPSWVKWGLPDTLKVTEKKIEKVYNHIQLVNEIGSTQRDFFNRHGTFLDLWIHARYLKERLALIVEKRDEIVRLTKTNPQALADSSVSKMIQDLNASIESEFSHIELEILDTKMSSSAYWERVEKLHQRYETEIQSNSQDLVGRLDADEEFLLAVSRFLTSPAESLIRGDALIPLSKARSHKNMIRGADGTPIEFRSFVFVEGTREPVFDALHDRGVNMIVFLEGADGVERQMIFLSNNSGLANTPASGFNLTPQELSFVQKWRPGESEVAPSSNGKALTVLKLDEVAPERLGPLARESREVDECPICISDLAVPGGASSSTGITFCPNCCKGFHLQCMMKWAQSKPSFSCPLCRSELTLNTLVK